jgi:hypothetical protein
MEIVLLDSIFIGPGFIGPGFVGLDAKILRPYKQMFRFTNKFSFYKHIFCPYKHIFRPYEQLSVSFY